MDFTIDDGKLEVANAMPPIAKTIRELLEKLPDGRLYTTRGLAQAIKCIPGTVLRYTHCLPGYSHLIHVRNYCRVWGNKKTIVALIAKESGNAGDS